jgi:hypothetical protein
MLSPGCNDCAVRWSCSLEADGPKFEPCPIHRRGEIDIHDPKYRFDERVQRLIGRIVEFVIRTKEGLTKSELRSSVEP